MTEPHADQHRTVDQPASGQSSADAPASSTGVAASAGAPASTDVSAPPGAPASTGVPKPREPKLPDGEQKNAAMRVERAPAEPAGPPRPHTGEPDHLPQEQARDWALVAHLGSFLAAYVGLGFLCPLVVLLAKGKASAYVRHHAVEALNFQLTALGAGLIAVVLAFVYVGLILLPFIVIVDVVLVVMGGLAARRGEWYRYPVSIRMIT